MNDTQKPSFERLLDWLEGRLSADEARQIEARLASGDAETEAEVDWLRSFLDTAADARSSTPPVEVHAALIQKFEDHLHQAQRPDFLQRLVAALTFDSAVQTALAGARSVHTEGKPRQLIFDSDLAEIALNIQREDREDRLTLAGQVFPKADRSPAGLSVQVLEPDSETERGLTLSDDLGEFIIRALPSGRYKILISAEDFEILLPEIPLQL